MDQCRVGGHTRTPKINQWYFHFSTKIENHLTLWIASHFLSLGGCASPQPHMKEWDDIYLRLGYPKIMSTDKVSRINFSNCQKRPSTIFFFTYTIHSRKSANPFSVECLQLHRPFVCPLHSATSGCVFLKCKFHFHHPPHSLYGRG